MIEIRITADTVADALKQLTGFTACAEPKSSNSASHADVRTDLRQPVQTPPTQTVPTSTQAYTLDMLSTAAAPLCAAGKLPELQNLLTKYSVASLPELPAEQYGAFATDLRQLGAQI